MRKRKPSGKHNPKVITLRATTYTDVPVSKIKTLWDSTIKDSLENFPEDAAIYRSLSFDKFIKDYINDTEWEMADGEDIDYFLNRSLEDYIDAAYADGKKR